MAPEQRDGKDYNHKVDIYAMGIILLELLKSFNTRAELAEVLESIRTEEQKRPDRNLVKRMISHKPEKRPEVNEILEKISELQKTKTSPNKKDVNLTH